jgi:hypothetical protein
MPRGDARDTKKVVSYALSDGDIKQMLGEDISVIAYPQLEHMDDIDQCFDRKGRCIVLYLRDSPTSGHWICLIRRHDSIEFFDPYGEAPEEQKQGLSRSRLEALDMEQPFLTALMKKKGIPVHYNTHPFQKLRNDIATCGRHCVVRLAYKSLPIEKYAAMIRKSGLSPDEFVSGVTFKAIGK